MISEFPDKNCKRSSLDKLLKKIQQTGMVKRKKGSGRPKTACTAQNISAVEELALSQESQPNTIVQFARLSEKRAFSSHL